MISLHSLTVPRLWRARGLGLVVLAALLLGLSACATEEPKPLDEPPQPEATVDPAEEEARRKAEEERRKAEEEARRIAEEQRKEREKQALLAAFGPIGEAPPEPEMPAARPTTRTGVRVAEGSVPFDEAVPPLPAEPTLRVAVFGHVSEPKSARETALVIGTYRRQRLEERLGMAVKIAYVSQTDREPVSPSEIRYRDSFLLAAQVVADALAAPQRIGPMTATEQRQEGVDLIVHLGRGYR